MTAPDSNGGETLTYTGVSELVKVAFLAIGSILLMILVWALVCFAKVPSHAAVGFTIIGCGSIFLALALVLPWRIVLGLVADFIVFLGREFLTRVRGEDENERRDDRRARGVRRTRLRAETKLRIDRGALGLWVPYIVSMVGVGWLIYYSGGIVDSPFVAIPVVMFTLVVLLIDLPDPKSTGGEVRSTRMGRKPRPPIWPFVVLAIVAAVFFAAMALLNAHHPAHLTSHPDDGAEIVVTLSTATVGIVLAAVARWSILRDLVERESSR